MDSKSSTSSHKPDQKPDQKPAHKPVQRRSKIEAEAATKPKNMRTRGEPSAINELGAQLIEQLPIKLREDIDMVIDESEQAMRGARKYVRENPREALGLAVGVGALAWTIFGTSPGRKVAQWGAMMAMPYVTKWIAERFDRGEVGGMQHAPENTDQTEHESTRESSLKTGNVQAQAQDTTSAQPKHTH